MLKGKSSREPTLYRIRKIAAIAVIWGVVFPLAGYPDSGRHTAPEKEIEALLNWAVYLSSYPPTDLSPEVKFVNHRFFVENACYNKECNVLGWYNDTGSVYIDEKLLPLDTLFSRSLLVHEMVHYLQHQSRRFVSGCEDSARREREAYLVQQQFYTAYGAVSPVRFHYHGCDPSQTTSLAGKVK